MRTISQLFLLGFAILLCSCGKREASTVFSSFDPEKTVISVGKFRNLDFSATGSGEGWNTGYGDKDWHYFASEEADDLVAFVQEIRDELRKQLEDSGANVHGVGESSHSFISYTLRYKANGRRGSIEVIAAQLKKGTGVDVRIQETP